MSEKMDCVEDNEVVKQEIYNPKKHGLSEGEELEMDETAYIMYHELKVEHSCLSFDIIRDNLGSGQERSEKYPYTLYAVSGSQAVTGQNNMLTVMKMSNLNKIKQKEGDSDDESESDDEMLDEETELEFATIPHNGAVNRVRTTQVNGQSVVASWSDMGQVHIWDLSKPVWAVNDSAYMVEYLNVNKPPMTPLYSVRTHGTEGYALDWSACKAGMLASGDNEGNICLTMAKEHCYETASQFLRGHRSSVEDLQWSPNQETVLASCSSDGSIMVWDTRDMASHVTLAGAHGTSDINVMSWNKSSTHSLVSGGDDGLVKVWDLRMARGASTESACTHIYDYHRDCAITSIEWCPDSAYVFACSSEDDQLTLWDISMEQDAAEAEAVDQEYPVHMLFNHMGQKEVKELHWHPQIPGLLLSTALEGFNVFRTISV